MLVITFVITFITIMRAFNAKHVVVMDLDGTALTMPKGHGYAAPRDGGAWVAWGNLSLMCTPVRRTMYMWWMLYAMGYTMCVMTARSERVQVETMEWLHAHHMYSHMQYFRPTHMEDTHPTVLKGAWVDEVVGMGYTPYMAWEDSVSNLSMLVEKGFMPHLVVHHGA